MPRRSGPLRFRPLDNISLALGSIEAELRGLVAEPALTDGDAFTIFNHETGLPCEDGTGLSFEDATREAARLNDDYDAMVRLVRAYVDGHISRYAVRVSREAADA